MSFAEAKQYLQQECKGSGANLYDHLAEVLMKVLSEKPEDALGQLENLSTIVKQQSIAPKGSEGATHDQDPESRNAQLAWSERSLGLFKKAEEEGEAPEEMQDLQDESTMFEWANVSFGKTETYRIAQAMAKMGAANAVAGLRLWGKILGLNGDYFVFEGTVANEEDEDEAVDPADLEAPGSNGVNRLSYWVCPGNDLGTFTKLPKVTRHHILSSRQIRKFFTGNLDAPVSGYPPFDGTEAHYLRATIARITSETLIAPDGIYMPDEEDAYTTAKDDNAAAEDPKGKTHEELLDLANWVRLQAPINTMGRQTPAPEVDNADGEAGPPPGFEETESKEPLATANEGTFESPDGEAAWAKVRSCPSSGGPTAIAVVRSQAWPGAAAMAFGRRFCNVYVGNGLPFAAASYTPPPLPSINDEFVAEEGMDLVEGADVLQDPTPPVEENADEEED